MPSLHALAICWTGVMIVLVGLVIYRSLVSMKEEDQLFLDPAEWQLEWEQRAILNRLSKLTPLIWGLAIVSMTLLALMVGVWMHNEL